MLPYKAEYMYIKYRVQSARTPILISRVLVRHVQRKVLKCFNEALLQLVLVSPVVTGMIYFDHGLTFFSVA